jgi:hypothetical protein
MPNRIQRKRTKGWRMPPDTVSITRPGRWGNPYPVPQFYPETSLALFTLYATNRHRADPGWLAPLVGKHLACWCAEGAPCHGDILLALANGWPLPR